MMKKMIIGMVACIIVFVSGVYFITNSITSQIEDEKEMYEQHLGDKLIIDKDTLTVMDYSMIGETFTLSNGQKVNYKLITNK